MKKLLVLGLILLPMVAMAQKTSNSIEKFFREYSELPSYESIEVTEEMFKMFETIEDADPEMVDFLSNLKFVRYLDYKKAGVIYGGVVTGVSVRSTGSGRYVHTYYVDGKKVTYTSKDKSTGIASASDEKSSVAASKISHSKSIVYDKAMDEVDLSAFTQLMKTNQDDEKMIFLKKEWTTNDREFVLLKGNTLINIRGDINIMHLYQLEEILADIGEILEF